MPTAHDNGPVTDFAGCSPVPDKILSELLDHGIRAVGPGAQTRQNSGFEAAADQILSGEADVLVIHLAELPVLSEGPFRDLVITALSGRFAPSQGLMVRPEHLDMSRDLRLASGCVVQVPAEADGIQLKNINPEINYVVINPCEADLRSMPLFISGSLGFENIGLPEGCRFTAVNPKEVIPMPGSGFWAFVTRKDDFGTRKTVNQWHQRESTAIANAERAAMLNTGQNCQNRLRVHVVRDNKGYFHVHAFDANPVNPQKFSFSTSIASQIPMLIENELLKSPLQYVPDI